MKTFLADQSGATAIEYGLIISLIFLVIVTALTTFGNHTSAIITNIGTAVASATS